MNLHSLLAKRNRDKGPLRVGLIGAGKFGSMYLAQAKNTAGIHLAAIADLDPARAGKALRRMFSHRAGPSSPGEKTDRRRPVAHLGRCGN
jgi:predicted homoserine dehydrogenase-like protein